MPSFPGSIVSLTNPTSGAAMNSGSGHADQHIKANDEIEAIETELGTNPSASFTTVGDRLADIESDVAALSSGAGLILITASSIANTSGSASQTGGKVDFTTVSSVSLNGVFTSTFDNYRIMVSGMTQSATADIQIRFRVSGTDNTSSNYQRARRYIPEQTAGSSGETTNSTSTGFFLTDGESATVSNVSGDIFTPYLSVKTGITAHASGAYLMLSGGVMTVTTSYDGLTLYTSSGTMTGTVRVYGYAK